MATKLTGFPQISGQDVYATSTTPNIPLGTYMETDDGRGFRYVKNGTVATVPGKVYQGPAEDTTNLSPSGGLSVSAATAGTFQVTLTSSITLAANALVGGYMAVLITPGLGQLYKIASNTAVTAAAGMVITLEDALRVSLTTASKIGLRKNLYDGVVVAPTTMTNSIVGVAPSIIPASTSTVFQYGWLQTHGICSALQTGTGTCGTALGFLQGGTEGSLAPAIAGTPILGWAAGTNITGEYGTVFLTIN